MDKLTRILYAEDSQEDIELTLAAFQKSNFIHPIDIVRNGEEALDYLFYRNQFANREKTVPAVILLDIKMPRLNGMEVLAQIRESTDYKSLPVVMLTSSQMEIDVRKSYELGANGYVVKPIDFNEFVVTIKSIGYFWANINIPPHRS